LVGEAAQDTAQRAAAVRNDPRARAYAQARRHSARVRFFKLAIPIGAAFAMAVVVGTALLNPIGRIGGLTLGPLTLSGSKITMESPRLTGFRKDTRPYEVKAVAATQDVRKPNVIELKEMQARLVLDDNGTAARLEAASGVFDTQKEQLELRHDVRVKTDLGHDAQLKSASIDFKAGTVVSREPVTVTMANGTIEAQGVEISDSGNVVVFRGRVRTVFDAVEAKGAPERTSAMPTVPVAAQTTGQRP
jgi:lipopolysaccharide export system protein LptC